MGDNRLAGGGIYAHKSGYNFPFWINGLPEVRIE